ncbi:MAG: putative molybdenum carrier protein [Nitrospiraceae bacterium]|nr:putative molybdenum carrier protein [Nitrospiraceae bacterium]
MNRQRISKIITGGQTGADRAGLDAAIELGIPYGGSIPSGRRTEDGHLPMKYQGMTETRSRHYQVRTEKNVVDSDATLLFTGRKIGSGSALTRKAAEKHHKAFLHINLDKKTDDEIIDEVSQWLDDTKPAVLNIAGSRETEYEGIHGRVCGILKRILGQQR